MNRRTVLVGTGAALSPAFSGCFDSGASGDTDRSETEAGEEAETETEADEAKTEPTEDGELAENGPRVDEPAHEIERPDPPADTAEREELNAWNEENEDYLGEHMSTDPSLEFESLPLDSDPLRESAVSAAGEFDEAYFASVVETENERAETFDLGRVDEETRGVLESTELAESILVVVETGIVSSSIEHRWARIEDSDGGIHLHGYYTDPYEKRDDEDAAVSVVEVERPTRAPDPDPDLDLARVSLTVAEDRRVHFDSTGGAVTATR